MSDECLQVYTLVHLSKGNRYCSTRDDGRRVEMQIIACQVERVQIPKDQEATHAVHRITCHECLKLMLQEFMERASQCSYTLKNTPYIKAEGFRFARRRRKEQSPRFEIDPELLARI